MAQERGPKRILTVRKGGDDVNWTEIINGDVSCSMVGDFAAVNYIAELNQLFVLSQVFSLGFGSPVTRMLRAAL